MAKIKTVEIKEVGKESKEVLDLLYKLENAGIELEEVSDVLTLVIDFFNGQHNANLDDYMSCWNLVQFTQKYNTVLKMARDKVDNLNADIKKAVKEY